MSLPNQLIVHNLTLSSQLGNANLKMLLSMKVHSVYLLKFLYGRGSRIRTYDAGVKVPCLTTWLYPYMVDLMRLELTTSSLQGKLSPIEIQTLIWWARLVSIQLLPKETDLQSAAVADLLLTHIMFTLFKILCELNYEMLTFRRTHGYIVY